jgi:hypothetical protein
MNEHEIAKALEVWSLQTLLDISIVLGVFALGLALVQGYYRALEKQLALRVSGTGGRRVRGLHALRRAMPLRRDRG